MTRAHTRERGQVDVVAVAEVAAFLLINVGAALQLRSDPDSGGG